MRIMKLILAFTKIKFDYILLFFTGSEYSIDDIMIRNALAWDKFGSKDERLRFKLLIKINYARVLLQIETSSSP